MLKQQDDLGFRTICFQYLSDISDAYVITEKAQF